LHCFAVLGVHDGSVFRYTQAMEYEPDYDYPLPEEEPEEPYWTVKRIVFTIITLLTLIAFFTYVFIVPLIEANQRNSIPYPTPTVLPRF
jgi:quinol-cytochrome oxidoreductase complex cytochrome b subunit